MSCERAGVSAFARWLALAAIVLAGCTPDICGRSSDCASGLICTTVGACVLPPVDASTDDVAATMEDAATTSIRDADGDAVGIEPIDAAPDAAPIDAVAADANLIDAPPDNVVTRSNFEGAW